MLKNFMHYTQKLFTIKYPSLISAPVFIVILTDPMQFTCIIGTNIEYHVTP